MEQTETVSGPHQTEQLGELAAALAKAQAAFPTIVKDRTVKVPTKSGANYSFKYADLADILKAVRQPLADNGLSIAQIIVGRELITMLMHSSNQRLVSRVVLPYIEHDPRTFGSDLTYRRRYCLSAILGIASDDDADDDPRTHDDPRDSEPTRQAVRTPARKSESNESDRAPVDKGDAGELASEGERKWLTNRAGDGLATALKAVGAESIETMTKAQFVSAKSNLMRAA